MSGLAYLSILKNSLLLGTYREPKMEKILPTGAKQLPIPGNYPLTRY